MNDIDIEYLKLAISIAWRARENGNHPFGAVLVDEHNRVVLQAENTVITGQDSTGHAETNLVRLATQQFSPEQLALYTLYSSTEPCAMCAGAIYWSHIGRVVYALSETDLYAIIGPSPEHLLLPCREVFAHSKRHIEVHGPISSLETEARAVHKDFWTIQHEPDKNNADVIALNQALVDELKKKKWIQKPGVEAAFRAVLRHQFLPGRPLELVYSDRAISAKQDQDGQWLSSSSQPAMMGIMLEQLELEPGHKVLEIGAGTGYNAALMAQIVGETGQVATIDIDEDLVQAARENLVTAGFEQVQVLCADGGYGYPDAAPFDRIILTVGAPDITPAWWEQLKPDGRIVLPLTLKGSMKSVAFEQVDNHLASLSVKDCSFIQLRGDFASTGSNQVQLGPDPGLYLETLDEALIDSDAAYDLLTGPSKDWAVGVEVTVWDALIGNLWTWLALHEPRLCKLVAKGDMVARNIVPYLIGIAGKQKSMTTAVLVGKTGLVALMRPPDQPLHLVPMEKLFSSDSPFTLFVRQFGSDDLLGQRLVTQIQTWDAAGRPSFDAMHIRAYPKDAEYVPSEGEILVEKQWTKLIIEWPTVA